jgi:hypothetical protein
MLLVWVKANFHAHGAKELVGDDGSESPRELHQAFGQRGFGFSVHSAHSTENTGPFAAARFATQRESEALLHLPNLTTVLGEELTVAPGPRFQRRTKLLGKDAPGNLEHLTLFGMKQLVPNLTPIVEACRLAHEGGGLCLVAHPGPGPMMWEEGWWEAPQNRAAIDGIEVYNGQALSAVGLDFEARYREATAYRGLGLKIAAVTGADTHGPGSVERARSRLAGLGAAAKLLKVIAGTPGPERPELEAATRVHAEDRSAAHVAEAVRARRTIATYGLDGLEIELPGLGEVKKTGDVKLALTLSRKLSEVTLYREGEPVRSWQDVDHVEWNETVTAPTAYVFGARDGAGRLLTSAIWYEPKR